MRYANFLKYKNYIFNDNRHNKLIFKPDNRFYYVYRITNIKLGKHYYGSRVTKLNPIEDLGIKYFSSSSINKFLIEQKKYPINFKYKVIKIFTNPGDSIIFESFLHQYFQVSKYSNFYNMANQTPFGFSVAGNKLIAAKIFKTKTTIREDGTTSAIESARKAAKTRAIIRVDGSSIGSDSAKKRLKTICKLQEDGSSIILDSAKKAKNTLNRVQFNGLTGYENYGCTISNTLNTVQKSGLTISEERGLAQIGKNNPSFNGYYITPLGKYESAKSAVKDIQISWQGIAKICKSGKKKISNMSYSKSVYLQNLGTKDQMVGRTWAELGFAFIEC